MQLERPSIDHYRRDIDGLRALAVVVVILFHAVPQLVPGGFIGVDVFFVISGYLISGIILRATRSGTFTLRDFYARRCRRILPALVVVLCATWVIARVALLPEDFWLVGKHTLGAATFTSNILFWREAGYFDLAAIRKPLLHLWSLAVEEQFYLLWPPLLLLATLKRWNPLTLAAITLAGSLALAIALMPDRHEFVFYMLPTRIWELLVGALLVIAESRRRARPQEAPRIRRVLSNVAATVGLLMIIGVCLFDLGFGKVRIAWLAGSVVGAALVIASPRALINRRLLALDAVVFVGLISYPLYLWHWPLLSVVMLLGESASVLQLTILKAVAIVLSLVFAWATWKFVELPVRRLATPLPAVRRRMNYRVLATSAVALSALAVLGFASWDRAAILLAATAPPDDERLLSSDAIYPALRYNRVSGAESVVLLLGDSHADHLVYGLVPIARKHGFGVSHTGFPGCLGIPLETRLWAMQKVFDQCQASATAILDAFVRDPAVKIVVFSSRVGLYSEGNEGTQRIAPEHEVEVPIDVRLRVLHEAFARAIRRFEAAGKRVVIALDIPEADYDPGYCVWRDSAAQFLGKPCSMARETVEARQQNFRALVRRLQQDSPNLSVFDPLPAFCNGQRCYFVRNGLYLYRGDNHVSADGSRIVAEAMEATLFPPRANLTGARPARRPANFGEREVADVRVFPDAMDFNPGHRCLPLLTEGS